MLQITDLRSQQVRDICIFLTCLAKVAGDRIRPLMRDVFANILDGVRVSNKVMSGYVDECIISLIRAAVFKTAIVPLSAEIRDNKAKIVRERCLEYLNEILITWDLADKEVDVIAEAVRLGLEDGSVKAREVARTTYLNLFKLQPHKAEKIKAELTKPLQMKLTAAEQSDGPVDDSFYGGAGAGSKDTEDGPSTSGQSSPNKMQMQTHISSPKAVGSPGRPAGIAMLSATPPAALPAAPEAVEAAPPAVPDEPEDHMTNEERAALAIQASMRGMMRRRSVVKNPFADISSNFSTSSNGTKPPTPNKTSKPPIGASPAKAVVSSSRAHSPSKLPKTPARAPASVGSSAGTVSKTPAAPRSTSTTARATARTPDSKRSAHPPTPTASAAVDRAKPKVRVTDSTGSVVSVTSVASVTSNSDSSTGTGQSNSLYPKQLSLNMRVMVTGLKQPNADVAGVIRFIGHTLFAAGIWIGVDLDAALGKNNGSVQGHYYFNCSMNHGIFVREENCEPLPSPRHVPLPKSAMHTHSTSAPSTPAGVTRGVAIGHTEVRSKTPNKSTETSSSAHAEHNAARTAGLLKQKISQLMVLLNQELAIVNDLEAEEKAKGAGAAVDAKKIHDMHAQVGAITGKQMEIVESFRRKWK